MTKGLSHAPCVLKVMVKTTRPKQRHEQTRPWDMITSAVNEEELIVGVVARRSKETPPRGNATAEESERRGYEQEHDQHR